MKSNTKYLIFAAYFLCFLSGVLGISLALYFGYYVAVIAVVVALVVLFIENPDLRTTFFKKIKMLLPSKKNTSGSDMIKTKTDYKKILTQTMLETAGYIHQFPEMGVYQQIAEELDQVHDVLFVQNRLPTFIECQLTSFAGIAVKNFADDNPEYYKKLSELSYYFERYEELE